MKLYDSTDCHNEGNKSITFHQIKFSKIIIYLFDLSRDDDISEEFINEIKKDKNFNKNVIYLVGNKLDVSSNNIEKYRNLAKKLIDRGKINKYFELSAKSKEGINFFLKHLQIDSAIIIDKKKSDPLNDIRMNFEMKYSLFKYQNL